MKTFLTLPIFALILTTLNACGTTKNSSNSTPPKPAPAQTPNTTPETANQQTSPTSPVTPPPASTAPDTSTASCYKGTPFICKIESLITDKTNAYRKSKGKSPVTHDPKIAFVARDWSLKQSLGQAGGLSWMTLGISHNGFPSARETVYKTEFNESRDFFAENVAMNGAIDGSGQTDADADRIATAFADQWWNSPGHKYNMLADHKYLGCGMAQKSDGSWYATQIFQ